MLRTRVLDILSQLRTDLFPGIQFKDLQIDGGRKEGVDEGLDELLRWMEKEGVPTDHVLGRGSGGIEGRPRTSTHGAWSQVMQILAQQYDPLFKESVIQQ